MTRPEKGRFARGRIWLRGLPRSRVLTLAWLALAGFILGVCLCPFNPIGNDRDQSPTSRKEQGMVKTMTSAVAAEEPRPTEAIQTGIQTATFAMG